MSWIYNTVLHVSLVWVENEVLDYIQYLWSTWSLTLRPWGMLTEKGSDTLIHMEKQKAILSTTCMFYYCVRKIARVSHYWHRSSSAVLYKHLQSWKRECIIKKFLTINYRAILHMSVFHIDLLLKQILLQAI